MGMPKRVKKYGLALVGVGVAIAVIAPVVIAATTDTDDSIAPASTVVHGSLKAGTKTTFVAAISTATVTLTCTASSASGKTPAHGMVVTIPPVSFTGCTDSLSGKDTVKTTGVWHLTGIDAPNDETTEPPAGASSGDKISVTVPIKGATVTSSVDPSCLITVAPTAPAHTVGFYDDKSTYVLKNASVPISLSSACPGGAKTETSKYSATYVFTPGVHDAS
jgi:hypothetical protein